MKSKLASIIIGVVVLVGCLAFWQGQSGFTMMPASATDEPVVSNVIYESPAIQDKAILEGWNALHSLKDPIQVGDGWVISGELLAHFLLENQIPVVWGSEAVCSGSSCSLMYCTSNDSCFDEDGQPGIDPIYLNPAIQDQKIGQLDRLAAELGHEAFHRMRRFGPGIITQVEEYWAFYLDHHLVKANCTEFAGVNSLDPQQVKDWFSAQGMTGYLRLPPYPGSDAQAPQQGHPMTAKAPID